MAVQLPPPPPAVQPFALNGAVDPAWFMWFTAVWRALKDGGGGGGGVTDGDKGNITVSGGGTVWTIDNGVVSTAKLGGDVTTAGKALIDDVDAAAQRTTLGLGTAATANTGDFQAPLVSGTNIKTINGASVLGSGDLIVGGSIAAQTATLDFGALSYNALVSIADTSVTSTTRVIPSVTVTGRDADELEMSPIVLAAYVTAGVGIDIYGYAPQGADGQFLISYIKA